MTPLKVTESELRTLLVTELEAVEAAEFDKARLMSDRLKIPLERALAERGRFPFGFLLENLAQAWKVGFAELRMADLRTAVGLPQRGRGWRSPRQVRRIGSLPS